MIFTLYKRAWSVMKCCYWQLLGLTWLGVFLVSVATLLGGPVLGIGIAASILLNEALLMIYLNCYRGEPVECIQLFRYFSDWKTIKRILSGMGWQILWLVLWLLIPVAGLVFFVIRGYEYRLTPYILATEPDVAPTQAIQISKERTSGYKGKMFGAEILLTCGFAVVGFILGLIGGLFDSEVISLIVMILLCLVEGFVLPVFLNLLHSAFYEEIMNPTMNVSIQADKYCTQCGAALAADVNFCPKCGTRTH